MVADPVLSLGLSPSEYSTDWRKGLHMGMQEEKRIEGS